MVETSQIIAVY